MPALSIADSDPIERDPDLVHAGVDGETVMMSIQHGHYFGLNEVGSRIWALLETPTSLGQLRSQLMAEYQVDAAECRQDVDAFVGELLSLGIVRRCPKP